MKIKAKKQNEDGLVRLETSGHIKEVFINEDLLKPQDAIVSIGFKGKSSSGLVEMSVKEVNSLYKNVQSRLNILKSVKVMKFRK